MDVLAPIALAAFAFLAGHLSGVRSGIRWAVEQTWERSGRDQAEQMFGEDR